MHKPDIYRQVAIVHMANINQGFLVTLGVEFLSLMYRAIDEARESVLIVEEREERVVGFVTGGIGMTPIYKRMLRYPIRLTLALLPSILRPQRFIRILEILRYSRCNRHRSAGEPEAELLSIAVDPAYRGQQIAERLYRRLSDHFVKNGIFAFKITAGKSLEPAHRFYRRMGAVSTSEVEVHKGEVSTVYQQRIT